MHVVSRRMANTTIHLTITKSLKEKLDQMAKSDRRDKTDFLRLLIEDEWNRRNGTEVTIANLYPNGADAPGVPTKGNGDRS